MADTRKSTRARTGATGGSGGSAKARQSGGPIDHLEIDEPSRSKGKGIYSLKIKGDRLPRIRELMTTYANAFASAKEPYEVVFKYVPDKAELSVEQRPIQRDALDEALAAARRRGTVRAAEILKSSEMVSAREFGELIGASHETVNQKRKAGELLALEGATRGLRYPTWQISADGLPLPGLAALTHILGGRPWSVYRFLLQHHGELGDATGLEALKSNRVEEALAVARSLSEGTFA